jgi:hypothetical protein
MGIIGLGRVRSLAQAIVNLPYPPDRGQAVRDFLGQSHAGHC